jgi:signal transduction histidine kinase
LIHKASFHNIEVVKEIQEEMPHTVGDIGQLQQVFTNLFINAGDAMAGKGKLTVKARFDQEHHKFIIHVRDTGPGIPEELRDKVFDIFFTTKAVGKGTGLGLSISQNIIKIHGGNLYFECPPEGGTDFVIELPLDHADTTSEEAVFMGDEPVFIGMNES